MGSTSGDDTYSITIDPSAQTSLLCGDEPSVTITVEKNGSAYAGDVKVSVSPEDGITLGEPAEGEGSYDESTDTYTANDKGEIIIPITGNTVSTTPYEITATMVDDSAQVVVGDIWFVPYKYDISPSPIKAVAGHPTQFAVNVLACEDDTETVVQGYSGDKKLKISSELTLPEGGDEGAFELSAAENDGYDSAEVSLEFSEDAKTSAYLKSSESGKFHFTLTDDTFVCPAEYDNCDGVFDGYALQGMVEAVVRPWTFAICQKDDTALPLAGHSYGGKRLKLNGQDINAGTPFDLVVKPIAWSDGNPEPGTLVKNVSQYCSNPITTNYMVKDDNLTANVELVSALDSPVGGTLGNGLVGANAATNYSSDGDDDNATEIAISKSNADDDDLSNPYLFEALSWEEAGSLILKTDGYEYTGEEGLEFDYSNQYLGMNIDTGIERLGRFPPDHLSILENTWTYAEGHTGFAYMNQPIHMEYTVEAQNTSGGATENYGDFADDLKVKLKLVGTDTDNNTDLVERFSADEAQDWDGADYLYSTDNFIFYKQQTSDATYTTEPDGPYTGDNNSDWGIKVTDATTDNVDFYASNDDEELEKEENDNSYRSFSDQPNFRYGRMVLDSVSSPIGGPVSVPLRAEYWDGESYVVNDDDNGSKFKTSVYCAVDEDSGEPSSASLTDTDNDTVEHSVDEGKSSIVQAKQSEAKRETARIFLRQGSDNGGGSNNKVPADVDCEWNGDTSFSQPWLQFNWRNKGDEDPSTVVSFGAYRGNDRIIFRGEEQLTEN